MGDETTYSGVLGELGRLGSALEANAPELAHLEGPRARLAKVLVDAKDIAKEQAELIASKQDASKRLKATVTEGQRLATGIGRFLQQHYGTRSEKLAEFGIQPFRGRKARTPKKPPVPELTAGSTPAPPAAHSGADTNSKE